MKNPLIVRFVVPVVNCYDFPDESKAAMNSGELESA